MCVNCYHILCGKCYIILCHKVALGKSIIFGALSLCGVGCGFINPVWNIALRNNSSIIVLVGSSQ